MLLLWTICNACMKRVVYKMLFKDGELPIVPPPMNLLDEGKPVALQGTQRHGLTRSIPQTSCPQSVYINGLEVGLG